MSKVLFDVPRWLGHLAIVSSLGGCATTATITRVDGRTTDAEIAGADRKNVYVKTISGEQPIPRSEITDIDHPGDTAAAIGFVLTAYGVFNIAVGVKNCDGNGTAYCAGVFAPVALGLPMVIWGVAVHTSSTEALQHPPESGGVSNLRVVPAVTSSDGKRAAGAVIQASF